MFRWISITSFMAFLFGIFLHRLVQLRDKTSQKKRTLSELLVLKQDISVQKKILKFIFLLGLLSFLALFVTGFTPVALGLKLQGYLLMIHATFAPVFIGCMAVIGLLSAGQYQFTKEDYRSLPFMGGHSKIQDHHLPDYGFGVKAGFWFLMLLSLPVTLTMVLSMLPLFGTDGQEFLYHAHRWSALAFGLITFLELYMLIRVKFRKGSE